MSRMNSLESKRHRSRERKFRSDAAEAAAAADREAWESRRPGPVARSVMSAFLRSFSRLGRSIPVDALFTFLVFGDDVDLLERTAMEESKSGEGFLEYARIRFTDDEGTDREVLFIVTFSVCGEHSYRNVFYGAPACSFRPVVDFFNSTFGFSRACFRQGMDIVPAGRVVSSSVPVDGDDAYLSEFMRENGFDRRQFLPVGPWDFLFRKEGDGSYSLITDVKEYNSEAKRINGIIDSRG